MVFIRLVRVSGTNSPKPIHLKYGKSIRSQATNISPFRFLVSEGTPLSGATSYTTTGPHQEYDGLSGGPEATP